jgi:hypothetical protein
MSIPEQVSEFLRQRSGKAYCDDCIAEKIPLKRRQQAQRVTGALAMTADFVREAGECAGCGADKLVTKPVK